jgi:hypothetical protein
VIILKAIGNKDFTTVESVEDVGSDFIGFSVLVVEPDNDCLISVNNNSNYQKYAAGKSKAIPGPVNTLYIKGQTGSGNLQYWCFK